MFPLIRESKKYAQLLELLVPIPFSGLFADVGIPPVPFFIVVALAILASFV